MRLPPLSRRKARVVRRLAATRPATWLMLFPAGFNIGFLMANGLLALLDPRSWLELPGVADGSSPLWHLLRDIGTTHLLAAAAFLLGLVRSDLRISLWAAATLGLTAQAALQFWGGPLDILPAANGALLCIWVICRSPSETLPPTNYRNRFLNART